MKKLKLHLLLPCFGYLLLLSCSKKGAAPANSTDTTKTVATIKYIDTLPDNIALIHDGGLHTTADFARIKANLTSEPWKSGWNKLTANSHAQLTYVAHPTIKLIRGGSSVEEPDPDNYYQAYNDVAAAYQTAVRWKVTGDAAYAEKSIQILNAWAATCIKVSGDPNAALAIGIYGYQFAVAGELMRGYSGWKTADFQAYQNWMMTVFYAPAHDYLVRHMGACPQLFWANWDLCTVAAVMSIGILTDKRVIYNEAVNYLQHGNGNGNLVKAINYVFTGADAGLAQWQESGRDQGHATLNISLLGTIFVLALNQKDDFFSFNDNLFLKACEYTAKYNVAKLDVPFHTYTYDNCTGSLWVQTAISSDGRGAIRPMWALPYNYYVKVKGLKATYTTLGVQVTTPEGGGGDYGGDSGGFDQLGFGTLLYTLP